VKAGGKKVPPSEGAGWLLRREKASTCAVLDAFENPQLYRGASDSVFGSHYKGGLASSEIAIGSQRVLHRFVKRIVQCTNTAEAL